MRRYLAIWVLWLVLGVLAGCGANTYQVKIAPFTPPSPPAAGETLIYVLRENTAYGSANKFAIVDNDTVMAVLLPGTFSCFKVPSGEHEIVAYVKPSPLMHYRVIPAPGKTVYLLCRIGYTTGMFIEALDEARAQALLAEYRYTEIEVKGKKLAMNYKDYYDKLYR